MFVYRQYSFAVNKGGFMTEAEIIGTAQDNCAEAEATALNNEKENIKKDSIKVTVVMPIYNAYEFLRLAIESVVSQTLSEIEIICIDDGSTDHSVEIVKEYQRTDGRIRIIAENNAGPALARNNGIKRARGEYIAFFDADDFYEPTFLEALYTIAERDNLDIAISRYDIYNNRRQRFEEVIEDDYRKIYKPGVVTGKNEHPDTILMSTVGSAWNKLFRTSFIIDKGITFLPDVKMYEDVYFTVTAMSLAERIEKIDAVLMHHRIHSEQSRAKTFGKYYSQVPVVYSKIKEFLMQKGMYVPLKTSYVNLTASRCYKIFNLLAKDSKEKFFNLLHNDYAETLGWEGVGSDVVESAEVRAFISDVALMNYDRYKKKLDREADERKKAQKDLKEQEPVRKPCLLKRIFSKK